MEATKEDRRDRFQRLATKRTNAVLEKIRILGNCANRSLYEFNEADVNKIFGTITKELQDVRAKFRTSKSKSFSL